MAYATYTTEAFVCGSRASNTSDKSFLLFTRDAGMVWAAARSVREERSKQRFALQDFSFIRVSLVRGKTGWRIGSVENETNVFSTARTREARAGLLRIVKVLRQFVQGEEPHPVLYADVRAALLFVSGAEGDEPERVADRFVLRLLHKLGYVAAEPSFESLVRDAEWIETDGEMPPAARKAIENALAASHL